MKTNVPKILIVMVTMVLISCVAGGVYISSLGKPHAGVENEAISAPSSSPIPQTIEGGTIYANNSQIILGENNTIVNPGGSPNPTVSPGSASATRTVYVSPSPSANPEPLPRAATPTFTVSVIKYTGKYPGIYPSDTIKDNTDTRIVTITIDNQPHDENKYGLLYNIRVKGDCDYNTGQYQNEWSVLCGGDNGDFYHSTNSPTTIQQDPIINQAFTQMNADKTWSSTTLQGFWFHSCHSCVVFFASGSTVSFQVQAFLGIGRFGPNGESSDWSDTQTVTIP
jgi:hypothetical protein